MDYILDDISFVGWGSGVKVTFLKSYLLAIQTEIFVGEVK